MSSIPNTDQSARRMARLAGLSYVIYTLAGLYITFGAVPPLGAFTDENTVSQSLLFSFRTGLLVETVLYVFVCISAAAMYLVLRSAGPGGALVAVFCRLVEGALGVTFIVLKYAAFAAVVHPELTPAFSGEERESLMMLLREVTGSALYFLLIPMAVGGVLFFSLFFRTRYIPRWLSAWGMLTYTVIGVLAASIVLVPELEQQVMLFFVPGALFEWVVALWLLFAGINTKARPASRAAAT